MPILSGVIDSAAGSDPVWDTPAGALGTIYDIERGTKTFQVQATNPEPGSITYSIVSGAIPTGASFSTSTGIISGTPNSVGSDTTYNFTVRATNASRFADRAFSFVVKAPIKVTYNVNAGSLQSFSKPSGLTQLGFKMWASGGAGGGSSTGGAGGYLGGKVNLSSSTSSLNVWVPDGGKYVASGGTVSFTPGYFPWGTTAHYGPGFGQSGSGGGGAALIDSTNNIYYAIAGGGGGGSSSLAAGANGGAGGGDYGQRGFGTTPGEGGAPNVGGKSFFDIYENYNWVQNNSFTNDVSDWNGYLGTPAWQSTGGLFGAGCAQINWSTDTVGGIYTGALIAISPNTAYSISGYIKGSIGTVGLFIGFEWFNSSITPIGGGTDLEFSNYAATVTPSSDWTKLQRSAVSPADAVYGRIIFYKTGTSGVSTSRVLLDGVTWNTGGQPYLPFFNGSTSNLSPNPSFNSDTSGWSAVNGASGVRITTDYYQGQTACYQLTTGSLDYAGIQSSSAISVLPGGAYTLGAYIKNVSGSSSRQMYAQFAWFNSGGGLISYNSGTPVTVTDQWTRVICTARAPSNAASCYIFVQYGAGVQSGWVTKIDAITLYNSDGPLPYSDASNPVFIWQGTTDNSRSTMRAGAAVNGGQYYGGSGSNSYTGSSNGGGEGGHGYYGGAGGLAGGAGGGSSWINPTYLVSGSKTSTAGNAATAPNTGDADYSAGIAGGGSAASTGGNGKVVITY